jgi:hypothetical protein
LRGLLFIARSSRAQCRRMAVLCPPGTMPDRGERMKMKKRIDVKMM